MQEPFALVLGCADARAPIELVFNQGANDLFVLRVAGNVLGQEILGSVDYALDHLPTIRLLVVLGHSHCGASLGDGGRISRRCSYLGFSKDHQLRSIVNQLFPAVVWVTTRLREVHGQSVIDTSDTGRADRNVDRDQCGADGIAAAIRSAIAWSARY